MKGIVKNWLLAKNRQISSMENIHVYRCSWYQSNASGKKIAPALTLRIMFCIYSYSCHGDNNNNNTVIHFM